MMERTTAAAANLLNHGSITPLQAGSATVLTSIASKAMHLPIVKRHIKVKGIMREIVFATILQGVVGIVVLYCER